MNRVKRNQSPAFASSISRKGFVSAETVEGEETRVFSSKVRPVAACDLYHVEGWCLTSSKDKSSDRER